MLIFGNLNVHILQLKLLLMHKITFLLLALFSISSGFGQSAWTKTNESTVLSMEKVNRNSFPTTFQLFHLDLEKFKEQLKDAPVRGKFSGRSKKVIYLPNEQGNIERFYVTETPIMEDQLARNYPMIKSYAAQGVDSPSAAARFSVTQFGLHNMTFEPGKSALYIDPFTENRENYIVYARTAISDTPQSFECLTDDTFDLPSLAQTVLSENSVNAADDSSLRTYRLALTCTGEYGAIFDGIGTDQQKKANIQAQMAITMTRVNGVYERDLAVTMIFVANNDLLIYFDPTTDPWIGEFNTKTAQTIDATIGFSNYDVGHNFNTSGGGSAGCIGCVCSTNTNQSGGNHKGRGFTGSQNPTGDAFDIDYVAHELGHQFGGFHTQSSSGCFSGSGLTEVEPGSGSTIMGYAGICSPNVQNASDAYFHYVNIRDITANIKTGVSSNCAQITNLSNAAPVLTPIRDYIIPISTPFVLSATATDADGDLLNYTWEQNNPESSNQANMATPTPLKTTGPVFRSVAGTSNPSRFFPRMATILLGQTANTWEVLPSVSRILDFALTVRDNAAGGGQTTTEEMKVTVTNQAGPFVITSQNAALAYAAGSNQVVTWNVANTDQAPVNAKFVDIYLSTNNGATFPILLASQVPNDGSELITIPNVLGSNNRIMVRGFDSIFFDVSNSSFTISGLPSGFALAFSGTAGEQNKSICRGNALSYTLSHAVLGNFSAPVTFSVANLPLGVAASFSPASATSTTNVILTLTTATTVVPQLYTINVLANSGETTKSVNLYANILNNNFSAIALNSPANAAGVNADVVNFNWDVSNGATQYQIQIATDANFTTVIENATVFTNSYSSTILANATSYFWRVQPKNEACSASFSSTSAFSTLLCGFALSANVPIAIPFQVSTVTSSLIIGAVDSVTINDLNVQLNISHTYLSDLNVRLTSPSGIEVQLFVNQCGSANNIIATFDDAGVPIVCGSNPAISGTVIPSQPLSAFNGQLSQGVWTLTVRDNFNQDGGTINSWGIEICTPMAILEVPKNEQSHFMVYPNPNNGNFNVQFKNAVSEQIELNVYDMSGRNVFNRNYSTQNDFNENIQLNAIQAGIYLLSIFDGERTQSQRIIIK
jgi:subtilisin-like proprotein convertase family protein